MDNTIWYCMRCEGQRSYSGVSPETTPVRPGRTFSDRLRVRVGLSIRAWGSFRAELRETDQSVTDRPVGRRLTSRYDTDQSVCERPFGLSVVEAIVR